MRKIEFLRYVCIGLNRIDLSSLKESNRRKSLLKCFYFSLFKIRMLPRNGIPNKKKYTNEILAFLKILKKAKIFNITDINIIICGNPMPLI